MRCITVSKEKWNEQFSTHTFTYGKEVNAFIKKSYKIISEKSDIACFAEGERRNAVYLATKGHTVTAFDQSLVGLKNAHELAKENNTSIKTIEQDLTLPLHKRAIYDAAIMVFGHVERSQQAIFIKNIIHSVKPGGYVLFEVYSEDQMNYQTGGPGDRNFLYDPTTILELIEPYNVKHFYYGEAERHEGYRHTGVCHVIQVIIKK